MAEARAEFEELRDDPEGPGQAPTAVPKQRGRAAEDDRLQTELLALTDPAARGPVALGVRDARTVGDTEVRIRGEAEKLGPTVPRGLPRRRRRPRRSPKVNPEQSGRLELARG